MANQIEEGDDQPKTLRFPDSRTQRIKDLGIELPESPQAVFDELLERAEDLKKIREIMSKDYSEIDYHNPGQKQDP